jgi:hypothetical protein
MVFVRKVLAPRPGAGAACIAVPGGALDWKSLGIEARPILEWFPSLFRELGAQFSFSVDPAPQDLSLPADDHEPGLEGKRAIDGFVFQKNLQGVSIQVNDIPGCMGAKKVQPGRGRLPHGRFRAEEGDAGALDLQLFQDSFQFRMILDDPYFSFPLEKAKPFEGLLRDAEVVREIIQNLSAFSFACEGGQ